MMHCLASKASSINFFVSIAIFIANEKISGALASAGFCG
jgi:hypothetical protein